MKYLLLVCAGLLAVQLVCAQRKLDVVYFKNGSVIRGHVYAKHDGVVRMENRIKDTLVFNAAEIDSMRQEAILPPVPKRGFYNIDEGGFQFSDQKGTMWRVIAGYRFAYKWQAGVGIGIDDYTGRSVPIFGDVRYNFEKSQETCFLFAGGGVALPWLTRNQYQSTKAPDKNAPGLYMHVGVGYKFGKCHLSAGYNHTAFQVRYETIDWLTGTGLGTYTQTDYSFNKINLLFGVTL